LGVALLVLDEQPYGEMKTNPNEVELADGKTTISTQRNTDQGIEAARAANTAGG
jgi:uncharacterized cupredoxin-like copper-binding protein